MDPMAIALIALRSAGALFVLQGKSEVSDTINTLIRAYSAGRNVDAYMAEIGSALEAGADLATWENITYRINSEVDDFLAPPTSE